MEEKSLIEKKHISLFERIKNFFKGLVNKNENKVETNANTNYNEKQENSVNMVEYLKNKQRIISLQKEYEAGQILEEDISPEDKQKLLELYNEQIETLRYNIEEYKKTLANYKEKILTIKNGNQ